ncbi:MAG: histidine kinase [Acidobacteriia bacterium]|nr:histidine kinase [Terriglobia bacterium]
MRRRVEDILLVSSLYDSFILAEDGQLNELILHEFLELNLRHTPGLIRVSSGAEAVALARAEPRYNLIITSMHLGDMDALTLARKVREAGLDVPVILLAYDSRELGDFMKRNDVSDIDRVFLWQGDVRILLAIVKYVEDRTNVAHDSGVMGVQVVLLVEDNVRFYSSFLPVIYTEIMAHSHSLVPEGINLSHKLMRIQARPKILLCSTYEEAWACFEAYRENVLGIISDIEFPKGGKLDREAGADLARRVRAVQPDIPIMLQSSHRENAFLAREAGAGFLIKGSPTFLQQLRRFIVENFSFGDFVFRLPDGTEVDRAHDLKDLEEKLRTVPAESLGHHGERNHFSNWLKARTEFSLAHRLRPRKVSDFATLEDLRADLIRSIQEYRHDLKQGIVADFDRESFDPESGFSRIGGGSLGGKARGLAFVNLLLTEHGARDRFPGVRISVPPSVVLATDVFDRFLHANGLGDFALNAVDDGEVLRRFLEAEFPAAHLGDLEALVGRATYPLAVRSSSLLEDSQYQPFAGIYETYMLPNDHPDPAVRLAQLVDAIKRVYASTFSTRAKTYLSTTPYRLEEEKMAVILQKVVGAVHGDRFYPNFAGVARSYNFYPTSPMTTEDGIAAVALGLGETVVDGEACIRFCPRYPRHLVQFSSVRDVLQNSQREFCALTLLDAVQDAPRPAFELKRLGLEAAEEDGTLSLVGSTYSPENDAVYDGISRPGVRLVNFAPILKHNLFPLAEILDALLGIGKDGTSTPVEIEFAVRLAAEPREPHEFGFLQLRPLALSREMAELAIGGEDPRSVLCSSPAVLGHGRIEDLLDVVVVDYHRFDRGRSRDVAREVARLNASLASSGLPYLLIGVGRWGSADPFLGIPVSWDQIAAARVIVEAGFRDFKVTPSQGTHFFQNITSSRVGYFTVNPDASEGFVDWDWLAAQPAVEEMEFVRHLRFREPLVVKMNGKRNEGVILKPAGR